MISPVHFYVRLVFDGLMIFVAQRDLRVVEISDDVIPMPQADESGVVGWLPLSERQYPVFSLSGDMKVLPELADQRYCVLLQCDDGIFGLTCDEVEPLEPGYHLAAYPMPEAMKTELSPFSHIIAFHNRIGCLTTASALLIYLVAWQDIYRPQLMQHAAHAETDQAII
jgi:hypothetical protein